MTKQFFQEQKDQSKIKTDILIKYFGAWSNIMKHRSRASKIAYIDLFSGPGIYEDGKPSTPVKLLEMCISDEELSEKVVTLFNDADPKNIKTLNEVVKNIPGIEKLKYYPNISCGSVGQEIEEDLSKRNLIPTLAFIDPFGYKGMTTKLIKALIKDFGSDCLFFFNYNRISMGIRNEIVDDHMKYIFGEKRHEEMKELLPTLPKDLKEPYIVEQLSKAISEDGLHYVLPFKFLSEKKHMTSHYLIFVSKHPLGYQIMKEIMAKQSTLIEDGVANFGYIPVRHLPKYENVQLSILDSYQGKVDELCENLLIKFKGKTLSVKDIFDRDNYGTNYVLSNYKEAIRRLEEQDAIKLEPPASKRRKLKGVLTVADHVKVTF